MRFAALLLALLPVAAGAASPQAATPPPRTASFALIIGVNRSHELD